MHLATMHLHVVTFVSQGPINCRVAAKSGLRFDDAWEGWP